jgi:hypothetical protein
MVSFLFWLCVSTLRPTYRTSSLTESCVWLAAPVTDKASTALPAYCSDTATFAYRNSGFGLRRRADAAVHMETGEQAASLITSIYP